MLLPENVGEVQQIVKDPRYKHVKVIGTRHCFGTIADTRANLGSKEDRTAHICLEKMVSTQFSKAKVAGEEELQPVVRFGAGVTYSQLIKAVDLEGLAI